jgi:hypothetical protein
MTYQQAVSMALDVAQRRQRPAYIIELAEGWAVSSSRPRRSRGIPIMAAALGVEESEHLALQRAMSEYPGCALTI